MARVTIVVEDKEDDPHVFKVEATFSRPVPDKPEDLTPAESAALLALHQLKTTDWGADDDAEDADAGAAN